MNKVTIHTKLPPNHGWSADLPNVEIEVPHNMCVKELMHILGTTLYHDGSVATPGFVRPEVTYRANKLSEELEERLEVLRGIVKEEPYVPALHPGTVVVGKRQSLQEYRTKLEQATDENRDTLMSPNYTIFLRTQGFSEFADELVQRDGWAGSKDSQGSKYWLKFRNNEIDIRVEPLKGPNFFVRGTPEEQDMQGLYYNIFLVMGTDNYTGAGSLEICLDLIDHIQDKKIPSCFTKTCTDYKDFESIVYYDPLTQVEV